MEESIEDMISRILGSKMRILGPNKGLVTEEERSALASEIQFRINNHVRMAVEEVNKSTSIVVTQLNIINMAGFTGVFVDRVGFTEDELETEYTIETNAKVSLDDNDKNIYQGLAIHITEYPEEGSMPLEVAGENK